MTSTTTTTNTKGTALITGASSGIGAIYAERLAKRGFDLILVARDLPRLDALAATLRASSGRKVDTVRADLTVTADLRAVEQRLISDSAITMLVNNAGLGATSKLVDSAPEALDELITLNALALTRLTRAVAPAMVARAGGTIINIASAVALAPDMLNSVYGASKAYVLALSQALHAELAPLGIRIQAVLPGAVATPFWDAAGLPVQHLPTQIVMDPDQLVDAALAGLDLGEVVTLPSLPEQAEWDAYDGLRQSMRGNLSRSEPAARYKVA